MVAISRETTLETNRRLLTILKHCDLKIYDHTYAFKKFSLHDFPGAVHPEVLALVRDDEIWSQLIPCNDPMEELFTVWRFHFRSGDDNSGFIGWLATHLKEKFGTGIFINCGVNLGHGGIFNYGGCPAELGKAVTQEIRALHEQEKTELYFNYNPIARNSFFGLS